MSAVANALPVDMSALSCVDRPGVSWTPAPSTLGRPVLRGGVPQQKYEGRRIRTTVEKCSRPWSHKSHRSFASRFALAVQDLGKREETSQPCTYSCKEKMTDSRDCVESAYGVDQLLRSACLAAAFATGPAMLPHAIGSGAVHMAAAPPVGPPMQNRGIQMHTPKDEEQFAELIFPGFQSDAFIWQITCFQIAEFALAMALGHNKANPTPCALYNLGASWGPSIATGQLWRLICPVFLHANMTHLLFNIFFQLRIGFGMEKQFGRNKMMLMYFSCGVIGNLLSVAADPFKLAVGASTAGFGLIGVWLAEIGLSWELMGPARERTVVWIFLMLVSVSSMSAMTPNMDLFGHFGGALGGFLLAIIISDMQEQHQPKWYGKARAAAVVTLFALCCICFGKAMLLTPRMPIPDCPFFSSDAVQGAAAAVAAAAKHS